MRIKLDENLPQTLADVLNALGHDADSVNDEGLAGHPDGDVWRAAQEAHHVPLPPPQQFHSLIHNFSLQRIRKGLTS
ncbi:MAG TPA: DUF5615 family PIN-like protein [Thermoanaerobaculia bacterium]|nr:DUF5615 family PIN-like protein [Thermoanaerobaculia bacterium]